MELTSDYAADTVMWPEFTEAELRTPCNYSLLCDALVS